MNLAPTHFPPAYTSPLAALPLYLPTHARLRWRCRQTKRRRWAVRFPLPPRPWCRLASSAARAFGSLVLIMAAAAARGTSILPLHLAPYVPRAAAISAYDLARAARCASSSRPDWFFRACAAQRLLPYTLFACFVACATRLPTMLRILNHPTSFSLPRSPAAHTATHTHCMGRVPGQATLLRIFPRLPIQMVGRPYSGTGLLLRLDSRPPFNAPPRLRVAQRVPAHTTMGCRATRWRAAVATPAHLPSRSTYHHAHAAHSPRALPRPAPTPTPNPSARAFAAATLLFAACSLCVLVAIWRIVTFTYGVLPSTSRYPLPHAPPPLHTSACAGFYAHSHLLPLAATSCCS